MPMFLHSGDVCVMSGLSRLAYHAVPLVLPSPDTTALACLLTCGCSRQCELDKDGELSHEGHEQAHTSGCDGKNGGVKHAGEKLHDCKCHTNESKKIKLCVSDTEFAPYLEYLKTSRINMNVRQVLAPGQTLPSAPSLAGASHCAALNDNSDHGVEEKKQKLES